MKLTWVVHLSKSELGFKGKERVEVEEQYFALKVMIELFISMVFLKIANQT